MDKEAGDFGIDHESCPPVGAHLEISGLGEARIGPEAVGGFATTLAAGIERLAAQAAPVAARRGKRA